ncbi:PLOD3 [Symbiodinium sp. CCMP2592]|nr:PLOD3 [Symbiodinium sp. CCMP2592]
MSSSSRPVHVLACATEYRQETAILQRSAARNGCSMAFCEVSIERTHIPANVRARIHAHTHTHDTRDYGRCIAKLDPRESHTRDRRERALATQISEGTVTRKVQSRAVVRPGNGIEGCRSLGTEKPSPRERRENFSDGVSPDPCMFGI